MKRFLWIGFCLALLLATVGSTVRGASLQAYMEDGTQSFERGDFRLAATVWKQGLDDAIRQNNLLAIGYFHTSLGVVYSELGDYSEVLAHNEQALKIARVLGDRAGEAAALSNQGLAYNHLGKNFEALLQQKEALKIAREIGDRALEGAALTNLGSFYIGLGENSRGILQQKEALKIAREIGDRALEAKCHMNFGNAYFDLGDYSKALAHFDQALTISRALHDRDGKSGALSNLAVVYQRLADYSEAKAHYKQALMMDRETGDREGQAGILGNLGILHTELGDYPMALVHFKQSLQLFQVIGVARDIMRAEDRLGDVYLEQGRLAEAFVIFQRSDFEVGLGRYYLRAQDYEAARAQFVSGLERVNYVIANYIGLGLAYEGLRNYREASTFYQKAVELIEQERDSITESQRRQYFAGKEMGFSRLEPYEGLVRVSVNLKDTATAFHWAEHTKARAFLDAIAQRGIENHLGLSEDLARQERNRTQQIASRSKQREATLAKQDQETQQTINQYFPELKEEYQSFSRLQATGRELSQLREDQQAFITRLRKDYPAYAALRYPQPVWPNDLKLRPREALITYEVTDTITYGWLIQGSKIIKTLTVPISRQALTQEIKLYLDSFRNVTDTQQLKRFDPHFGKRLYQLIFKDFEPFLRNTKHITVVPDEVLGLLPFEALVVDAPQRITWAKELPHGPYPQDVHYLSETYHLTYAQSATAQLQARALKRHNPGEGFLVVADPVFEVTDTRLQAQSTRLGQETPNNNDHSRFMSAMETWTAARGSGKHIVEKGSLFPRLPLTGRLIAELRLLYGEKVEVLSGLAATEPNLRQRLEASYRTLLFSTHGILDNDIPYIREPALVLSQVGANAGTPDHDGFLTLTEVMELKLPAELAVLSACQTGIGKRLTGEGVMGMGRAFQYAGTRQVVMSLWSVEESATVLFTERLFSHLRAGQDALTALGYARSDLRQAGYSHPFYWAPFILVGQDAPDTGKALD